MNSKGATGPLASASAEADDITASIALARMILAKKVNDLVAGRGLTQMAAAELLGMPQSKISAIQNYKLKGISLERLMQALAALGQHVQIADKPSGAKRKARVYVVT
ncbi:MAG: XRE family transcriptional regulator [Alphaproteobacteria bacterium]|nr:XRE family transcriptional regulator [Alphaproteobacteria bacterium]